MPGKIVERESPFLEMLRSAPADHLTRTPTPPDPERWKFRPLWYFFYGTLTNPELLSRVLSLTEPPVLRPAKTVGWQLAKLDQYVAMIDAPNMTVTGFAYLVQSREDEEKLIQYESSAYRVSGCRIKFTDTEDDERVDGRTFKYAGDPKALVEGRFDTTLWERRMGMEWPLRQTSYGYP